MRKAIAFISFVAVAALGSASSAAPGGGQPTPAPGGLVPSGVSVAPFLTAAEVLTTSVDAGGVTVRLRFSNPSKVAFNGEISIWRNPDRRGLPAIKAPLVIAAGASAGEATYVDASGINDTCESIRNYLSWSGQTSKKAVFLLPVCKFTATLTDPTAPIPPDTLQAQKQGKLFYFGSKITSEMSCSFSARTPLRISTTVKNGTSATVTNVRFDVNGTAGVAVSGFAPGASKPLDASVVKWQSGRYTLKLVDVDNSTNGAIWQPGHYVDVKRSCTVTAELHDV